MKKIALLIVCITSLLNGMEKKDPNQPDPSGVNHLARLPLEIQCYIASFLSFRGEETDLEFIERIKTHENGKQPVYVKTDKGIIKGKVEENIINFGGMKFILLCEKYDLIGISQNGKHVAGMRLMHNRTKLRRMKPLSWFFGLYKEHSDDFFHNRKVNISHLNDTDKDFMINTIYKNKKFWLKGNYLIKDEPRLVAIGNSYNIVGFAFRTALAIGYFNKDNYSSKNLHIDQSSFIEAMDFNAQCSKLGIRMRQKNDETKITLFDLVKTDNYRILAQWFKERGVCKNLKCSDLPSVK